MEDKNGWGGVRAGAGRPAGSLNRVQKEQRKQHQLRAYDDEWKLVKAFHQLIVKKGKREECEKFLQQF